MRKPSKAPAARPAFTLGHAALWAVSLAMGAFGVWGWIAGADNLPAQILLAGSAGLSACVLPSVVHWIGGRMVSWLLVLVVLPFVGIASVGFHNAEAVLIEEPRKEAATERQAQAVTDMAKKLATAESTLAALPALVLPDAATCRCPATIRDMKTAWLDTRAPFEAAVTVAKAEHAAAVLAYEKALAAYVPLVPDMVVLFAGAAIDLAIALGIAVLSVVAPSRQGHAKKLRKRKGKAKREPAAKATAPRGRSNWKPTVVGS
jgi:hypothetical protein